MLSRREFRARRLVANGAGLIIAIGGAVLVDHVVRQGVVRWLLESLAVAAGMTASQLVGGTDVSYRKYVAAVGGPDDPPSIFWATRGPSIIVPVAAVVLAAVTFAAVRSADGGWLRGVAGVAWPATIGAVAFYLLIARDWRDELRSRAILPDEHRR